MGGRRGAGSVVTKVETQRDLRGPAAARKPNRKPDAADRLDLWLSTGKAFDGLWVGTTEGKPQPGVRRIEDALRLIKHHDPLHYSRVIHNLERVWVRLLPGARACYDGSLGACMLDLRFVLPETTTVEEIASAIVHEATHAKLERWGISYDEKARARIEAVCIRRELNFIAKLPHSEPLREQKARALEWCVSDHDYFSNESFQQRGHRGNVEALRYLGTPEWVIRFILRTLPVVFAVRRLIRRLAGPPRQM
jgi:hypothetical protein